MLLIAGKYFKHLCFCAKVLCKITCLALIVESLGHLLVVHVDILGGEEEEMYNLKRMIF